MKIGRAILGVCILFQLLALNPRSGAAQGTPTGSECKPFPINTSMDAFPEVRGKSDHQELWALLFFRPPITIGEDTKIVWRMTGSGDFSLTAHSPDGTTISPNWGPEAHGGSSWERPGQEWGAGFNFPKVGCWRVMVTRGTDTGEIDFLVVDYIVI